VAVWRGRRPKHGDGERPTGLRCGHTPNFVIPNILGKSRRAPKHDRRQQDRIALRDVRFWHEADMPLMLMNVCFEG